MSSHLNKKRKPDTAAVSSGKSPRAKRSPRTTSSSSKTVFIVVAVIIAVLVISVVVATYFSMQRAKQAKYMEAMAMIDEGNVADAYDVLSQMGSYGDSAELVADMKDKLQEGRILRANIGEVVEFGTFEQDNDLENGEEPIQWTIMDSVNGKVLLVCNYALDCRPFNNSWSSVTWESCSIRTWLNGDFYNNHFTDMERLMIATVENDVPKNPQNNIKQGNPTSDKIFLLSIKELNTYFPSGSDKQCAVTPYAESKGAYIRGGHCRWWLRTLGDSNNNAINISETGSIRYSGNGVDFSNVCIRPALWIDLHYLNDDTITDYFYSILQDPDAGKQITSSLSLLEARFGEDYSALAFKAAVKASNKDYVVEHIEEIPMNPSPGNTSPYLLAAQETQRKDMLDLILEQGASYWINLHSAGR